MASFGNQKLCGLLLDVVLLFDSYLKNLIIPGQKHCVKRPIQAALPTY